MLKLNSIAVYCGSNPGKNPIYNDSIQKIAKSFVENNLTLVYGGANVGLMGALANDILSRQGRVIGVIPQSLVDIERAHKELTHLHVVNSMHERKKLMSDLSDGFILMPGGTGSLDEFFEIITWLKLGYVTKPCGILNINNYYQHMIQFLQQSISEGFTRQEQFNSIYIEEDIKILLERFKSYKSVETKKGFELVKD